MKASQLLKSYRREFAGVLLLAVAASALAGGPDAHCAGHRWSGFYMGGNVGYIRGDVSQSIAFHNSWLTDGTQDDTFLKRFTDQQLKANGFIGGAQAGYRYQIQHWVPGVVMDFDYVRLNKNYASGNVFNAISGNTYTVDASYKTNWLLTLRPQLGYSFGRVLPYLTGGFAAIREKYSQTITQRNLVFTEKAAFSKVDPGWTIGAGADVALRQHWQLMAEYLYARFRSKSAYSAGSVANYDATHAVRPSMHVVRLGVSYVFN